MAIQREIIESEIRTTGGKQVQDELLKVNQAIKSLAQEEKNLIFVKNKLEAQGKKNTEEWKKNEAALKTNREAAAKQREELTKLNGQLKITEMTYNQLSKRAAELRGKLNNTSKELNPTKWNQYNNQLKQVDAQMQRVKAGTQQTGGVMSSLKGAVGALGLTVGAATVTTKLFNATMQATQGLADEWEKGMIIAKASTDLFFKSLASGDWKNFGERWKKVREEAEKYADILDALEDKQRSLGVQEEKQNVRLKELEQISRDVTKSNAERKAALVEINKIEAELAEKRKAYSTQEYEASLDNIAAITGLSREKIKTYVEEFDSLENVLDLYKEYLALGGVEVTSEEKKRRDEIKQSLESYGMTLTEVAQLNSKYNELNGKELDELGEKAKAKYQADASYYENTMRANARLASLNEKTAKEEEKVVDNHAKVLAEILQMTDESIANSNQKVKDETDKILEEELNAMKGHMKEQEREVVLSEERKMELIREYQEKKKAFLEDYQKLTLEELKAEEFKLLEFRRQELLANDQLTNEQRLVVEKAYQEGKAQIEEKYFNQSLDKLQDHLSSTQALFSTMSDFVNTMQETDLSELERRKERELDIAGDNADERKKIEEEYSKKEKAIKKKYADATFAMQVSQIIATTAQTAIEAYKAMAGIPYIGPVLGIAAAGAAIAYGGVQLQKATEERNAVKSLFTGGYSGDGDKYEVAGRLPSGDIYHRQEYVVASEELNNPQIGSFIRDVVEPVRVRRIGGSSYSGSIGNKSLDEGGFSSTNQQTNSNTKEIEAMNRQNELISLNIQTMNRQNEFLEFLARNGVFANFDQNKIFELKVQLDKLEEIEKKARKTPAIIGITMPFTNLVFEIPKKG